MTFPQKIIAATALTLMLVGNCYVIAATQTNLGTVSVAATVLGSKPLVYNLYPSTGANNVGTAITAVVGRNFTGATLVTLDDSNSTVLSSSPVIVDSTDSDATVAGVGGGGTYQKITGLTVPAGLAPGTYNILVTTNVGTNIVSDVKFTATAPTAGTTPQIIAVAPEPVITETSAASSVTLSASDTDTTPINYSVTNNGAGAWSAAAGTITMTAGSGSVALTYTAEATDSVYSNTFSVNDGGAPVTKNVLFYVQPGGW